MSIALLIRIQELLVVAQQLVANGGCLVVAGEVAHVGKDAACKVDAATPAIGLIVALIGDESTPFYNLPV